MISDSVNGSCYGCALIRVAWDLVGLCDLLAVVAVVGGVTVGGLKPIARSRAARRIAMDVSPLAGVVTVAVVEVMVVDGGVRPDGEGTIPWSSSLVGGEVAIGTGRFDWILKLVEKLKCHARSSCSNDCLSVMRMRRWLQSVRVLEFNTVHALYLCQRRHRCALVLVD